MRPPSPPPSDHRADQRRRQAALLKVIIVFLLISALVVGIFVTKIPLPLRLTVAATDVILAAVLALVVRQKFSGR